MKNYIDRILLGAFAVFAAVSCGQTQDTRFFAPELEFSSGTYSAASESGSVDVALKFSRPAQMAFDVALMYGGTLEEGVQFKAPRSIDVAEGAVEAVVHIELVDDEIWDENSIIELFLVPGTRYTVNPDGRCQAKVNVSKTITVPILRLTSRQESLEVNPYLAESLEFKLESNKAPSEALKVDLSLGGLVPGKDYLLDGAGSSRLELPAGKTSLPFTIKFVQKDISGYDTTVALSLVPDKQHYVVASGDASPEIHLYDPVVDLGPLWKTAAQNNGTGYQIRQAIKAPDGSWEGNSTMDMWLSSEGSNYVRSYRNLFDHPSFGCKATASASLTMRLSDMVPNLKYPKPVAILDYGNDQGHRSFVPCDSLFRFVLDKGSRTKGRLMIPSPRTFVAFIGSYSAWQDKSSGENAWVLDSRATGGDIFASTHPAITGKIEVRLMKLEGTFDLENKTEPLLFTAWFICDAPEFMQDVDMTKWAVSKEGGLWKVEYKLWPR